MNRDGSFHDTTNIIHLFDMSSFRRNKLDIFRNKFLRFSQFPYNCNHLGLKSITRIIADYTDCLLLIRINQLITNLISSFIDNNRGKMSKPQIPSIWDQI